MKNFAKRISALVLAVVVSAAVLCPAAFAAQLPSLPKDQCVVDDANALNSQVTQTIEELNAKLETNCKGAQIGVLTVQYTGNLSTEDYATEAFNAWGIGNATNNNGVLILLVMESAQYADGDYYLTYGDGFRNTTLAKQASAIAQTMESDFANRDYSDAVITCANNVADTIASIYGVNLDNGSYENGGTVQPGYQGGQSSGGSTLTDILTLVVSVVLLIVIIRSVAYVFASPCGWLWCFGGPRLPADVAARRRPRRAASTAALAAWAAAPSGAVPGAAVSAAAALAAASVAWAVVPATAAAVAVGDNENKRRKAVALYHCLSLFYAFYRE